MEIEIQCVFYFFIFMKELKNELLKKIRINFMVIFTIMFLPSQLRSSVVAKNHPDAKNPLFRKQLMYFNVSITSCYFHICFILILLFILLFLFYSYFIFVLFNFDIKHISRSSHREVFSLSRSKKSFINSLEIVKVNLKFKQKPLKIKLKDFILCPVDRKIPIIQNTFSYSNKLLPLR